MPLTKEWEDLRIDKRKLPPPLGPTDDRKALRALTWIASFIRAHGYSPNIREVAEGLNYTSTSSSNHWLNVLETRGWITRPPRISRSISITEAGQAALERASRAPAVKRER